MEYMYLVSSPSDYVLGAKPILPHHPIDSNSAENTIFRAADGLIRKKGCKEMSPPPSKTDKKSLKRKTRKKAKRNKNHHHNAVSSSHDTSAGSSVLDEHNNNGRSNAEKSGTSLPEVSAESGFSTRKSHARRKNLLSGTTADFRTLLPRKQLKGSSNTVTRTGKENSYSVWQKVQRNELLPLSGNDIDKGSSICCLKLKDEASNERNVSKEKACKKSKRKSLCFKEGILQQNGMLVKCVPRVSYKNSYPGSGLQTLRVEFVNHDTEDKETSVSELIKVDQTSKEAEIAEFNKHGSVLQKWIPIGIIKEPGLSNSVGFKKLNWDVEIPDPDLDTVADVEDRISLADECVEKTISDSDDSSRSGEACLVIPTCYKDLASLRVRSEGIVQAVNDTITVQLASEAIEFATGCPIAEFERLLHSTSPSVSQSNISLRSLWQWYEKHGIYGLEVKAEDHQNSIRLGIDQLSFRAYFVPFLSAIQLFGEERKETQNNGSVLPILSANATDNDGELLLEYFEFERPQLRQPLYEKIHELARGDGLLERKMFGDPSTLVSTSLQELHKKSWYSVAWYPIYKIPDGSLRAAFLTYHSFGHLVERKPELGSPTMVCPVVGLQSYNAQDECWFQPRHSAGDRQTEEGMIGSSQVLKERLRTLKETACCMARATIKKGEEKPAKNWHPDYEFFLSRQLY